MNTAMRDVVLELARTRYGTQPEHLWAATPTYAVLRHPNQKWYAVVMDLPRGRLSLPGEGAVSVLNVQCDPILAGSLRLQPGVLPGYHMNKEKWITVLLDGTVEAVQIGDLLDMSYRISGEKLRTKHTARPKRV